MKFSVIVPVYNTQAYLAACCDSVLNQTYRDCELILIDDGSADFCGKLCDQIADNASGKCTVIHTTNQGPLLARRTGVRAATGDVIVFLDADDCIRRDALQILADKFSETNSDVILYNASDSCDYLGKCQRFAFSHLQSLNCEEKSLLYRMMACSQIPNSVCLKAAKKHCLESMPDFTGLSFVKNGEDLLMSLYMLTAAQKIVYLDESLYFYRQREGSAVHSYNPDRAKSIKYVHQEMERFIDQWGMPELHPAHCAREVHGWIETMLILMNNRSKISAEDFLRELRNMASDRYFIKAYEAMDPAILSRTYRILARWLYEGRLSLLHTAAKLKTLSSRIKKKSKI